MHTVLSNCQKKKINNNQLYFIQVFISFAFLNSIQLFTTTKLVYFLPKI